MLSSFSTVTTHSADFVGSATEVALIVAVPTLRALISPFWSTETVSASDVAHVTDLSAASQGYTAASRVSIEPLRTVSSDLLISTFVTATFLGSVTVLEGTTYTPTVWS